VATRLQHLYWRALKKLDNLPFIGIYFWRLWIRTPPGKEYLDRIARILAAPILRRIDEGWMRKIISVKPLAAANSNEEAPTADEEAPTADE
jgi:hypothetical protein